MTSTLVLDLGAHTIKAGTAGVHDQPLAIPNLIAKHKKDKRVFVGSELSEATNKSNLGFMLPFHKGFLTDPGTELRILTSLFSDDVLHVNPSETTLYSTFPMFSPEVLRIAWSEVVFEELDFAGFSRGVAANGVNQQAKKVHAQASYGMSPYSVVVDIGHSRTSIIPYQNHTQLIPEAVRVIPLGGKALTSQLKELISYRSWNVMEETLMINDVKENACYVSANFHLDMDATSGRKHKRHAAGSLLTGDVWSDTLVGLKREYVMPDYVGVKQGYLRPTSPPIPEGTPFHPGLFQGNVEIPVTPEVDQGVGEQQLLRLGNERFSVPELLFNPSDIGMNHAGLAEAIVQAVEATPTHPDLRGMYYSHIVVTGGSSKFPGLIPRLQSELRSMVPDEAPVSIIAPTDPITAAWSGCAEFAKSAQFKDSVITREEYLESGNHIVDLKASKYFS